MVLLSLINSLSLTIVFLFSFHGPIACHSMLVVCYSHLSSLLALLSVKDCLSFTMDVFSSFMVLLSVANCLSLTTVFLFIVHGPVVCQSLPVINYDFLSSFMVFAISYSPLDVHNTLLVIFVCPVFCHCLFALYCRVLVVSHSSFIVKLSS